MSFSEGHRLMGTHPVHEVVEALRGNVQHPARGTPDCTEAWEVIPFLLRSAASLLNK